MISWTREEPATSIEEGVIFKTNTFTTVVHNWPELDVYDKNKQNTGMTLVYDIMKGCSVLKHNDFELSAITDRFFEATDEFCSAHELIDWRIKAFLDPYDLKANTMAWPLKSITPW